MSALDPNPSPGIDGCFREVDIYDHAPVAPEPRITEFELRRAFLRSRAIFILLALFYCGGMLLYFSQLPRVGPAIDSVVLSVAPNTTPYWLEIIRVVITFPAFYLPIAALDFWMKRDLRLNCPACGYWLHFEPFVLEIKRCTRCYCAFVESKHVPTKQACIRLKERRERKNTRRTWEACFTLFQMPQIIGLLWYGLSQSSEAIPIQFWLLPGIGFLPIAIYWLVTRRREVLTILILSLLLLGIYGILLTQNWNRI